MEARRSNAFQFYNSGNMEMDDGDALSLYVRKSKNTF